MINPTKKIVTPADLVPANVSHCPECKTVAPPFGFVFNRYNLGILGQIEYFTIYCAAAKKSIAVDPQARQLAESEVCGCILTVAVVAYLPPTDPRQIEELVRQMRQASGSGGGKV